MKKRLTKQQAREIEGLEAMTDDEINTSDIPEVKDWRRAEVGKFYRPIKKSATIRLDADVLAWLKSRAPGTRPGSTPCCVARWRRTRAVMRSVTSVVRWTTSPPGVISYTQFLMISSIVCFASGVRRSINASSPMVIQPP